MRKPIPASKSKKQYVSPKLTTHGTVANLTLHNKHKIIPLGPISGLSF